MNRESPLTIERREGQAPGTRIFLLAGPVTLPNLFQLQSELRGGEQPTAVILDLSAVPYMDSAGMGAVINYFTHCQNRSVKFVVAGVSERVLELFKMTKVDSVMSIAGSLEEAEARV
jgi:anti-sigma B factor antagonist